MPRINTADSIRTSEVSEKGDSYDLNSGFKADHMGTIYEYNAQDNIVLWSDLCGKPSPQDPVDNGLAGSNYVRFAQDRSVNGNDNKLYGKQDLLARRFSESNSSYVLALVNSIVNREHVSVTDESIDMCGDPCFFLNLGLPVTTDECKYLALGADHAYIPNNSDLHHTNDANSADKPFSLSLWYYPIDGETNPTKVYDKGGDSRLFAPTLFHKTFEYALYMRECGKLEFVLYDVNIDVTTVANLAAGPIMSYSASAATLTVRSDENVLVPGQWNHIVVTYDGSATRAGMKIYVNCTDRTNTSDVPSTREGPKTSTEYSSSSLTSELLDVAHLLFMFDLYHTDDNENPASYTNMKKHSTPLVFMSSAYVESGTSLRTPGGDLAITPAMMNIWPSSQLPGSFLFDFAMWTKELDDANVKAVCEATRNCAIKYSILSFRNGDSGYINLSPKIMKQIRDTSDNSLSVIDRLGDRSERMVRTRPAFNDNTAFVFGKSLVDNFSKGTHRFFQSAAALSSLDLRYKIPASGIVPNEKNWESKNVLIRRERRLNENQEIVYDQAAAFLTDPAVPSASLITNEYYNNVIVRYDLILGPYNKGSNLLDLQSVPKEGANLLVEIRPLGGTFKTVKTHTVTKDQSQEEFFSPDFDKGIALSPVQHGFRRTFILHFSEIDSAGLPYQIRFRTANRCWGIGRIEILSANQTIRPPLLINHRDMPGKFVDSDFIATPHTRSDIETTGRTMSGISDSMIILTDKDSQKIKPFSDDKMLPFAGRQFFTSGIDSSITPGFSAPLKDKTQFTIELNSGNSTTDIGFLKKLSNGAASVDTLNSTQPIYATWDNVSKEWIQPPKLSSSWFGGFKTVLRNTTALKQDDMSRFHKQPFGSIDLIGSASGPPSKFVFNQFDSRVLSSYNQPVTSFGFPHQSRYGLIRGNHASKGNFDRLIKMSDYITKPFLLEKVVMEFDASFEFGTDTETENAFRMLYVSGTSGNPSDRHYDNASVLIPSCYILNVKKNVGKLTSSEVLLDDDNKFTRLNLAQSSFEYSGAPNVAGETSILTSDDKLGCDLITYGQMTMFITGSGMKMNMKKALSDGLARDGIYDISKLNGQSTYSLSDSITDIPKTRFILEIPVRNMPKLGFTQRSIHKDGTSSPHNYFGIYSNNPSGGRTLPFFSGSGDLNKNVNILPTIESRGLINNLSSADKESQLRYLAGNTEQAQPPRQLSAEGFRAEDDEKSTSPYLLMPEDRISIGFVYPVPFLGVFMQPDSSVSKLNKMTLGGKYKLHFYGSLVKEGKEYHENMNQALTTAQISEPIGCESVVDKFNIATRDQYFKSYLDKIPIGVNATSVGNFEFVYNFQNRSFGRGSFHVFGKTEIPPTSRIGTKIGSSVYHFHTYRIASSSINELLPGANRVHGFTGRMLSPVDQQLIGALPNLGSTANKLSSHHFRKSFTFPFVELYNNRKRYADQGLETEGLDNVLGKDGKIVSRERYVFAHDHFGYMSDMLDTAKDSRSMITTENGVIQAQEGTTQNVMQSLSEFPEILSSPVSVKFVSSASIDNDRFFYEKTGSLASNSFNKTNDASILAPYYDKFELLPISN